MKGKITAILVGTMLALTGTTMSASATLTSTINQQEIGKQQTTLILAKKSVRTVSHVKKKKGKYLKVKTHRLPGSLGAPSTPGKVFRGHGMKGKLRFR